MFFTKKIQPGDDAIDIYAESGFASITYIGIALQAGGRVVIGSGALQLATPEIIPSSAVTLTFEDPPKSACPPYQKGATGSDILPGWETAPKAAAWTAPGVLQVIVECDPVTLKIEVLGA